MTCYICTYEIGSDVSKAYLQGFGDMHTNCIANAVRREMRRLRDSHEEIIRMSPRRAPVPVFDEILERLDRLENKVQVLLAARHRP